MSLSEKIKAKEEKLTPLSDLRDVDCMIMAVAHNEFKAMKASDIRSYFKQNIQKVLIDVKGIFSVDEPEASDFVWWRL